jgi:hypothetical protein
MSTKLITPEAMLSYPHLGQPQPARGNQKPKYSATLIFPKGTNLAAMLAAAIEAATEKFGATMKVGGKSISIADALAGNVLRTPFRTDVLAKGYPEGSTFINIRSDNKPGVVYNYAAPGSQKPAVVADADIKKVFYPGAIVRASVSAFGYEAEGNKGISFGLNNVQFLRDGERIDGRVSAEDEFTADLAAAPSDLAGLL